VSGSKKAGEERMVLARQRREKAEEDRLNKLQKKIELHQQRLDNLKKKQVLMAKRKPPHPENVCIQCFSLCALFR